MDIKFDDEKYKVTNKFSNGKRGLELSELIVYNGQLLACDDKTGIIYQLIETNLTSNLNATTDIRNETTSYKLIPTYILADGNGRMEEAFKCEWLAVKDRQLYVGSFGHNFMIKNKPRYSNWIKRVNMNGLVEHLNWTENFRKLKAALGLPEDGYVSHETAMWSSIKQKWFFLPRKG